MNWSIIIGIILAGLLVGMMVMMGPGFFVLLGLLLLLLCGGVVMWLVYKWIFPPGWQQK